MERERERGEEVTGKEKRLLEKRGKKAGRGTAKGRSRSMNKR